MSSSFALYDYQQESLDHVKAQNTIVNLPTGFGKTLIAVKAIDHYLRESPEKRIAFLVPTRPLVEQQADYCSKHCRLPNGSTPIIQKLVGQDQAAWLQSDWDKCLQKSHILLGTAALLQQAFVTDNRVSIGKISLIIFDECHNACGNSPMAVVMRDGVAPYQTRGLSAPRILGLTASFVNGSLDNINQKRRKIEELLLSTMFCPDVQQRVHDDSFKAVNWEKKKDADRCVQAIEDHVTDALNGVGNIKELNKVVKRCVHVFDELGYDALAFYIDKVIVDQIIAKASILKDQREVNAKRLANSMVRGLPSLRQQLASLKLKLNADPMVSCLSSRTSLKLDALVELLLDLFSRKGQSYRGIVFVEQVSLVSALAKMLNDNLPEPFMLRCGAVAGTGYQSENDRQTQLRSFQSGKVRLLVATATLEEGIDVSDCAFVIRFTSVATTKAHIQGAGRARHPDAVIYYFENNPREEREKEAYMTDVAKMTSLSLRPDELAAAEKSISIKGDGRHPYPFRGQGRFTSQCTGEVNVFNAKQIFNQYCSMSLGSTVRPKQDLYKYKSRPGEQKILSAIRFPTPGGWQSLGYSDYQTFWGNIDVDSIVSFERSRRKSQPEKEEMCFVYVVVVFLRENRHLDSHNLPESSTRPDVRRMCPLSTAWSNTIAIRNAVFQSYT